MPSLRMRTLLLLGTSVFLILITFVSFNSSDFRHAVLEPIEVAIEPPHDEPPPAPHHPLYRPKKDSHSLPIVDNFPLAQSAHSAADLPPIPAWNAPPKTHVPEKTPLMIGFTRNWRLIQQAVVSYITAGWPAEDIYVIENTGTQNANEKGNLSLQNPFFLNHTRLALLGVNVVRTPTLLTFSQLQNFYLHMALENHWDYYWWGHMDVVALSDETRLYEIPSSERDSGPTAAKEQYESLYMRAVKTLRETLQPDESGEKKRWATRFFAYDRLALVNRKTYEDVGGWDSQIPYYMSDCDMHERLAMEGYSMDNAWAGLVYDVGSSLDDLSVLYRLQGREASFTDPNIAPPPELKDDEMNDKDKEVVREKRDVSDEAAEKKRFLLSLGAVAPKDPEKSWVPDALASDSFKHMMDVCDAMQRSKNEAAAGRNTWQARQAGGRGEPYYRDPEGFERAVQMSIEFGRMLYAEKWGHRDCALRGAGLDSGDEWRVGRDWEWVEGEGDGLMREEREREEREERERGGKRRRDWRPWL